MQKKPGDTKCTDKARATCAKVLTVAVPAAEAKIQDAIAARCAAIFPQAGAANAIDVDGLAPACAQVGVAALTTSDDWGRCVMRQHECAIEAALSIMAPRFTELLAGVGQSAASGFCAGIPTPTATATPTATPTPTATLSPTPTPTATQPPNVVFVSSQQFATDLGGATAYDTQCNMLATSAGINNMTDDAFVAWVSDSSSNAVTRLGSARGFVRVDGEPFADTVADLTAGKLFHPLSVDENGDAQLDSAPLTGTLPDGTVASFTCADWTTAVAGFGGVGLSQSGPEQWTSFTVAQCVNTLRIYCFMNTRTTIVQPAPASGKRIFLTASPFVPGSGDPDALCEAEKPAGTGSVVALLARTTAAASTLLDPTGDLRPSRRRRRRHRAADHRRRRCRSERQARQRHLADRRRDVRRHARVDGVDGDLDRPGLRYVYRLDLEHGDRHRRPKRLLAGGLLEPRIGRLRRRHGAPVLRRAVTPR